MIAYQVILARSAKRELYDFPNDIIARLVEKLQDLGQNPRPPGCKKLRGHKNLWRVRSGDYRMIYAIDDAAKTVDVTRIAHRREVYE